MTAQLTIFGRAGKPRIYRTSATIPRGYAAAPGSGPADETCGSCLNCITKLLAKRSIYKCRKARLSWTNGRGSDVLLKSPACSLWENSFPVSAEAQP